MYHKGACALHSTAFWATLGHLSLHWFTSVNILGELPLMTCPTNIVFTDDSLMNIAIVKSNIPHLLVSLLQDKSLDVVWDCTEIFTKLAMHSKSPL
jgi:hypothetical protein